MRGYIITPPKEQDEPISKKSESEEEERDFEYSSVESCPESDDDKKQLLQVCPAGPNNEIAPERGGQQVDLEGEVQCEVIQHGKEFLINF